VVQFAGRGAVIGGGNAVIINCAWVDNWICVQPRVHIVPNANRVSVIHANRDPVIRSPGTLVPVTEKGHLGDIVYFIRCGHRPNGITRQAILFLIGTSRDIRSATRTIR